MNKWTVKDRYGNTIYCTEERWQHILESRPEIELFFGRFLETVRTGRRKQDPLLPNEYRYYKRFDELLPDNNHLDEHGQYVPNNFVVTGWAKYIRPKR
jgi:hypothetical protein